MIREPKRKVGWSAKLFLYAGIPGFLLFTLALHVWTVVIAWAGGGAPEGLVTLFTPVGSWLLLAWRIGSETGNGACNYAVCVGVWLVSALLVGTAWSVNRGREL